MKPVKRSEETAPTMPEQKTETKTETKTEEVKKSDAKPTLTEGQKIWNEIKNKKLSMFALPNVRVEDYCKQLDIEPNHCFIMPKVSAVIAGLEDILDKDLYTYETQDKYIVIGRKK